jgi:transposase-like protein
MNPTETTNKLNELLNADAEAMAFIFSIILALSLIYITKSKIVRHKQCPSCKKDKAYRTAQNSFELYILRLESYKKYKCVNCARAFSIKN